MLEKKVNPRFLDHLVSSGRHLVTGQVQPYLIHCGGPTIEFLEKIIEKELVSKEMACRLWGDSLEIAYVNPLESLITGEAVQKIPMEIAQKACVIGLFVIEGVMTVAMAHPEDESLRQRISGISGLPVSAVFAPPREIQDAIRLQYETEAKLQNTILDWSSENPISVGDLDDESLERLINDSSIAQILDKIIFGAIRARASDIHMEPLEEGAIIRYRIDGKLQEVHSCGKAVLRAFIIRCKVLSKLNITESRLPQDGRFSLPFGMGSADFRFSDLPTQYGSKGVIRVLSGTRSTGGLRLDDLKMLPEIIQPFRRVLHSPNGILLVTGPTGSGKTTTLYAALDELNQPDVNISTIEDPIEIRLPGVNQSQVNTGIGLNFNSLLRSLLRQDPDILLLGEIRDGETAEISVQAALTGHVVLSTLHTNTAVQAIVRLIDLGVEPYLVAPALMGVLAQRLARRICEKCHQSYVADEETLRRYFKNIPSGIEVELFRGSGCPACRNTGYHGRVGLHELVVVDDEMRSLIARNASQSELISHARGHHCRSLRYDALKKVLLGLTTMDEIDGLTVTEWEFAEDKE